MAAGKFVEGDVVSLRGEVTRVSGDGRDITVRLHGYGIPLMINRDKVELEETAAAVRRRKLFDNPD